MGKDYYTQDGKKISTDKYGRVHDSNGNHLGNVDEYGKFHNSQYGKSGARVDDYGYIIDDNGKRIGKIDGMGGNRVDLYEDSYSSSSSSTGSSPGCLFGLINKLIDKLGCGSFLVILAIMWLLGMIFCIAIGDAPWD